LSVDAEVGLQLASIAARTFPSRFLYSPVQRSGELDIPLLDLLPILRSQCEYPAVEMFYDQCHHTPTGNELIARAIADFLAPLL
jgi:hypothetical protein